MSGPDGTGKAGPEETHGSQAPQGPVPPVAEPEAEAEENLPARLGEERLAEPVVRTGMFGVQGTPDTPPHSSKRSAGSSRSLAATSGSRSRRT